MTLRRHFDLNDDEKRALRRLQKDKYVIARNVHGQAFESLVAKEIVVKEKLSIRANGEVEPCTIGTMGKGYGNIHDQSLSTIVNQMN